MNPKQQSKADRQRSLLLMQAIQQGEHRGTIVASKDGKQYLRIKESN